ncbi:hypothetical protein M422DRAFT_34980 [Sphaerobolus stellatus SS14]|uniref:Extradiol ring-cleavage dioxygenase class III enzyme subunit B domain-containing protein n=1 Tax=Sphaerobolus stellatus (strain SS14) TaxID=990650 RepID=A0A0C9VAV6_SPHS4|nr:hypothetical protein M422DRAFT_34980 [Sphaerobolus stellatus SS14]
MSSSSGIPKTPAAWQEALAALPSFENTGKIPAFYFGHGQPMLMWPESMPDPETDIFEFVGPKDFGPVLLEKYKPKAIVVFSGHWETSEEQLVTDYGNENPLFMDYFGFPDELYKVQFKSRGDSALAQRIVHIFKQHNIPARKTTIMEARGQDGRGFASPGLDHGVFTPFKLMFGDKIDIPIVQVSIDQSLSPEKNWAIGKAISELRSDGVLVLSGGLTIHNLRDWSAFNEATAEPVFKEFDSAVIRAAGISDPVERRKSLLALTSHAGFKLAHPRAEHFIPIYVAAGCGEEGESRVVSGIYGSTTVAFGL